MNLQSVTNNAVEINDLSVSYSAVVQKTPTEKSGLLQRSTKTIKIDALQNVDINFQAGKEQALLVGMVLENQLCCDIVGVLKPSSGQVQLWGRPHLLSPGMGFNRTLSGREMLF